MPQWVQGSSSVRTSASDSQEPCKVQMPQGQSVMPVLLRRRGRGGRVQMPVGHLGCPTWQGGTRDLPQTRWKMRTDLRVVLQGLYASNGVCLRHTHTKRDEVLKRSLCIHMHVYAMSMNQVREMKAWEHLDFSRSSTSFTSPSCFSQNIPSQSVPLFISHSLPSEKNHEHNTRSPRHSAIAL